MKQAMIFLIMMGLVTLNACSSNETTVKADEATSEVTSETNNVQSSEMVKEEMKMEEKEAVVTEMKSMPAESDSTAATESTSSGINNKISVCKHGDQVRIVSVVYKQGETSTSCEVTYEKDTGVKTLWSARFDTSYCETKAKEFVAKQEGWGWVCSSLE